MTAERRNGTTPQSGENSPRVSALGGSYANAGLASSTVQFRRALALAAMTIVLPGSAQLVQGNRVIGRLAIRVWLGCLAAALLLGFLAVLNRGFVLGLFTDHAIVMTVGRWLLIGGAVAWVALLADAWRLGQTSHLRAGHRLIATGFNGALAFVTASVLFFAAHTVAVQNQVIGTVFASDTVSKPHEGRYNILLLGADSGDGRDGLRPDSLNLVSVDADSGKAVMIGLPRNLEDVPFPKNSVMGKQFPDGFDCEGCMLNGVYTWAEGNAGLFKAKHPGIPATIDAVEEITGLGVNYYAIVDMKGFSRLIDAVGGVTVNVRERTAIGGIGSPIRGYIEAGEQKLSGDHALWYARSRVENDDWSRMGRQKCVINAMLDELDPKTVLLNVNKISKSSESMLETNIPRRDLNTFMDLALKTKSQPVASVSLVPPVIYTGNPDWKKVRSLISTAIAKSEGSYRAPATLAAASLPLAKYSDVSVDKDPRGANQTEDLDATC